MNRVLLVALLWISFANSSLESERPDWAFFVPSAERANSSVPPKPDRATPWTAPRAHRSYTLAQIQDVLNPPDWYPDEHAQMPHIVAHGSGGGPSDPPLLPCALCHLPNGAGHVESASLAGLSAAYIVRQFADFRSGARHITVGSPRAAAFLTSLKKRYTDDQVSAAAQYFASLRMRPWIRVVETKEVPVSAVNPESLMRTAIQGTTESLGNRIVELPENVTGLLNRDSHSGFIAYVPRGSIAAGKMLVTTGGRDKSVVCATCHGSRLTGIADVPPLAGRPPTYLVRQLWNFQSGERSGTSALLMQTVASRLTTDEMLNIAAYIASRPPD
jgi:cytochrome c553